MKPITKDLAIRYHEHMAEKFDAVIVNKKEFIAMLPAGAGEYVNMFFMMCRLMGIDKPQEWLDRFAVTLGNFVCVPWVPGQGTTKQLKRQIVVLAHEFGHVEQFSKNPLGFPFKYASDEAFRGHAETDCLHINLEVGFAVNGKIPSTAHMVKTLLDWYFIDEEVAATQKKNLEMYAKIVKQGAVGTPVGKAAIKFLS